MHGLAVHCPNLPFMLPLPAGRIFIEAVEMPDGAAFDTGAHIQTGARSAHGARLC